MAGDPPHDPGGSAGPVGVPVRPLPFFWVPPRLALHLDGRRWGISLPPSPPSGEEAYPGEAPAARAAMTGKDGIWGARPVPSLGGTMGVRDAEANL